jgi:hypothetical protein
MWCLNLTTIWQGGPRMSWVRDWVGRLGPKGGDRNSAWVLSLSELSSSSRVLKLLIRNVSCCQWGLMSWVRASIGTVSDVNLVGVGGLSIIINSHQSHWDSCFMWGGVIVEVEGDVNEHLLGAHFSLATDGVIGLSGTIFCHRLGLHGPRDVMRGRGILRDPQH